jgi:hypothetical protein
MPQAAGDAAGRKGGKHSLRRPLADGNRARLEEWGQRDGDRQRRGSPIGCRLEERFRPTVAQPRPSPGDEPSAERQLSEGRARVAAQRRSMSRETKRPTPKAVSRLKTGRSRTWPSTTSS